MKKIQDNEALKDSIMDIVTGNDGGWTYPDLSSQVGVTVNDARRACEELCDEGKLIGHKAGRQRYFRYFYARNGQDG